MSDKKNSGNSKYPTVSFVEDLGSQTAEAICASMVAANDDALSFGPMRSGTSLSRDKGLTPNQSNVLSELLSQLQGSVTTTPVFKGVAKRGFDVVVGGNQGEEV